MQTVVKHSESVCGEKAKAKSKPTKTVATDTEESYNPEFVEKIRRAELQPSKKIDLGKYGISI